MLIEITKYIEDVKQGRTTPAICHTEEDEKYIVKGRHALDAGLIKEFICAGLARGFGLSIPDFCIAEFSLKLFRSNPDLVPRFSGAPCFASKFIPGVQEFGRYEALSPAYAQKLKDLFIFDFWIQNDDRYFNVNHGGNPNLLVETMTDELYVIDHNLAFAQDFDLKSFRENHVGANHWYATSEQDLFLETDYEPRIHNSLTNLDALISELPVEWIESEMVNPELITEIKATLERVHEKGFWSDIR